MIKRIMQGDQYNIPFEIADKTGTVILPEQVETVEIAVGKVKKTFPNEINYLEGKFLYPVSQEETFDMTENVDIHIRVKFVSGDVVGTTINGINVVESISKEVL